MANQDWKLFTIDPKTVILRHLDSSDALIVSLDGPGLKSVSVSSLAAQVMANGLDETTPQPHTASKRGTVAQKDTNGKKKKRNRGKKNQQGKYLAELEKVGIPTDPFKMYSFISVLNRPGCDYFSKSEGAAAVPTADGLTTLKRVKGIELYPPGPPHTKIMVMIPKKEGGLGYLRIYEDFSYDLADKKEDGTWFEDPLQFLTVICATKVFWSRRTSQKRARSIESLLNEFVGMLLVPRLVYLWKNGFFKNENLDIEVNQQDMLKMIQRQPFTFAEIAKAPTVPPGQSWADAAEEEEPQEEEQEEPKKKTKTKMLGASPKRKALPPVPPVKEESADEVQF